MEKSQFDGKDLVVIKKSKLNIVSNYHFFFCNRILNNVPLYTFLVTKSNYEMDIFCFETDG